MKKSQFLECQTPEGNQFNGKIQLISLERNIGLKVGFLNLDPENLFNF